MHDIHDKTFTLPGSDSPLRIILAKPTTGMNACGPAVKLLLAHYGMDADPNNIAKKYVSRFVSCD